MLVFNFASYFHLSPSWKEADKSSLFSVIMVCFAFMIFELFEVSEWEDVQRCAHLLSFGKYVWSTDWSISDLRYLHEDSSPGSGKSSKICLSSGMWLSAYQDLSSFRAFSFVSNPFYYLLLHQDSSKGLFHVHMLVLMYCFSVISPKLAKWCY